MSLSKNCRKKAGNKAGNLFKLRLQIANGHTVTTLRPIMVAQEKRIKKEQAKAKKERETTKHEAMEAFHLLGNHNHFQQKIPKSS